MRKCRSCKLELPSIKDSLPIEKGGFCSFDCKKKYKPKAKDKKPKAKVRSLARLLDDAAVLCQRMVKLKAADSGGNCSCVTCGIVRPWHQMQGGHFIERGKKATKIDETNIHPQCPQCNQWGMKSTTTVLAYRQFMLEMYGEDYLDELLLRSKQPFKPTRDWIAEQVEYFKEQISFHEARLGIK